MLKIFTPSASLSKVKLTQGFSQRKFQQLVIQLSSMLQHLDKGLEKEAAIDFFISICVRFIQQQLEREELATRTTQIPHETIISLTPDSELYINLQRPDDRSRMINSRSTQKPAFYEAVTYVMTNLQSEVQKQILITNLYEWYVFEVDDIYRILNRQSALATFMANQQRGVTNYSAPQEVYRWIDAAMESDILPVTYFNLYGIKEQLSGSHDTLTRRLVPIGLYLLSLAFAHESVAFSNDPLTAFRKEMLYVIGKEEMGRTDATYLRTRRSTPYQHLLAQLFEAKQSDTASEIETVIEEDQRLHLYLGVHQKMLKDGMNSIWGTTRGNQLASVLDMPLDSLDLSLAKGLLPILPGSCLDSEGDIKELPAGIYYQRLMDQAQWMDFPDIPIRNRRTPVLHPYSWASFWVYLSRTSVWQSWYPYAILKRVARSVLRRSLLHHYNEHLQKTYNWDQLRAAISDMSYTTAYQIFLDFKIMDPSAGKGQWLITMLHELIYMQHELGLLFKELKHKITDFISVETEDFGLYFSNENGELYTSSSQEETGIPLAGMMRPLRERLYQTKMDLINHCIYGISLHSYDAFVCKSWLLMSLCTDQYQIRGRSKLSWVSLKAFRPQVFAGNVLLSRRMPQIGEDAGLAQVLDSQHIRDPRILRIRKLETQYQKLQRPPTLLTLDIQEPDTENEEKASQLLSELKQLKAELKSPFDIWKNYIEWHTIMPSLWNANGKFKGVNVIVSTPPAIRQENFKSFNGYLKERFSSYDSQGNYALYVMEMGLRLLQPGGYFSFCTADKWKHAAFGEKFRVWLNDYTDYTSELLTEDQSPGTTFKHNLELRGRKKDFTFLLSDATLNK